MSASWEDVGIAQQEQRPPARYYELTRSRRSGARRRPSSGIRVPRADRGPRCAGCARRDPHDAPPRVVARAPHRRSRRDARAGRGSRRLDARVGRRTAASAYRSSRNRNLTPGGRTWISSAVRSVAALTRPGSDVSSRSMPTRSTMSRTASACCSGRPAFTAIALLVFAIGIGATTAIVSVADALLMRAAAGAGVRAGHDDLAIQPRHGCRTADVAPGNAIDWIDARPVVRGDRHGRTVEPQFRVAGREPET